MRTALRIALGSLLILASVLKLLSGEGMAIEAMRLLDLAEDQWSRTARAVQAVALFEFVLGLTMLAVPAPRKWILPLGLVLAGFLAWDLGRYFTGGVVDCGCLGSIKLATVWGHVWLKHGLLLAIFVWLATTRSRHGAHTVATWPASAAS